MQKSKNPHEMEIQIADWKYSSHFGHTEKMQNKFQTTFSIHFFFLDLAKKVIFWKSQNPKSPFLKTWLFAWPKCIFLKSS